MKLSGLLALIMGVTSYLVNTDTGHIIDVKEGKTVGATTSSWSSRTDKKLQGLQVLSVPGSPIATKGELFDEVGLPYYELYRGIPRLVPEEKRKNLELIDAINKQNWDRARQHIERFRR